MPPARCLLNPTNTEVAQLSTKSTKWRRAIGAPGIHPDGEQPKTALWPWVPEITWYLYTRGVRGRMKAKQRWFKVTRELCHEWFHHFRHHVHDGHWTGKFATVIWRLHCFTVSFRGDSAENPAPDNSPQSIGELRNGHVANLQELYHTRLVRKMAWFKIVIQVLIM